MRSSSLFVLSVLLALLCLLIPCPLSSVEVVSAQAGSPRERLQALQRQRDQQKKHKQQEREQQLKQQQSHQQQLIREQQLKEQQQQQQQQHQQQQLLQQQLYEQQQQQQQQQQHQEQPPEEHSGELEQRSDDRLNNTDESNHASSSSSPLSPNVTSLSSEDLPLDNLTQTTLEVRHRNDTDADVYHPHISPDAAPRDADLQMHLDEAAAALLHRNISVMDAHSNATDAQYPTFNDTDRFVMERNQTFSQQLWDNDSIIQVPQQEDGHPHNHSDYEAAEHLHRHGRHIPNEAPTWQQEHEPEYQHSRSYEHRANDPDTMMIEQQHYNEELVPVMNNSAASSFSHLSPAYAAPAEITPVFNATEYNITERSINISASAAGSRDSLSLENIQDHIPLQDQTANTTEPHEPVPRENQAPPSDHLFPPQHQDWFQSEQEYKQMIQDEQQAQERLYQHAYDQYRQYDGEENLTPRHVEVRSAAEPARHGQDIPEKVVPLVAEENTGVAAAVDDMRESVPPLSTEEKKELADEAALLMQEEITYTENGQRHARDHHALAEQSEHGAQDSSYPAHSPVVPVQDIPQTPEEAHWLPESRMETAQKHRQHQDIHLHDDDASATAAHEEQPTHEEQSAVLPDEPPPPVSPSHHHPHPQESIIHELQPQLPDIMPSSTTTGAPPSSASLLAAASLSALSTTLQQLTQTLQHIKQQLQTHTEMNSAVLREAQQLHESAPDNANDATTDSTATGASASPAAPVFGSSWVNIESRAQERYRAWKQQQQQQASQQQQEPVELLPTEQIPQQESSVTETHTQQQSVSADGQAKRVVEAHDVDSTSAAETIPHIDRSGSMDESADEKAAGLTEEGIYASPHDHIHEV